MNNRSTLSVTRNSFPATLLRFPLHQYRNPRLISPLSPHCCPLSRPQAVYHHTDAKNTGGVLVRLAKNRFPGFSLIPSSSLKNRTLNSLLTRVQQRAFANHLFSHSCALRAAQLFCFDILPKNTGGGGRAALPQLPLPHLSPLLPSGSALFLTLLSQVLCLPLIRKSTRGWGVALFTLSGAEKVCLSKILFQVFGGGLTTILPPSTMNPSPECSLLSQRNLTAQRTPAGLRCFWTPL
jgi:hypothetical protein